MFHARAYLVVAALLIGHQMAIAQFINSRDLKQDPEKLKVCMARAHVTEVGEFEIDQKYVDWVRKDDPDATFVLADDDLVECGMNDGTGKYGPVVRGGEDHNWHFIRPEQFKPGLATPEGKLIVKNLCEEAAKAKLDTPNFDHFILDYSGEVPRVVRHYTPLEEADAWSSQFWLTDSGLPVVPYDIEVSGKLFYKNGGLDLTGVSVLCLLGPMHEIKAIKTRDMQDPAPPAVPPRAAKKKASK